MSVTVIAPMLPPKVSVPLPTLVKDPSPVIDPAYVVSPS